MSQGAGADVWEGGRSDVQRGLGTCTVMSNAFWVIFTWGPPCEQTDKSENITILQLRWRAVIIIKVELQVVRLFLDLSLAEWSEAAQKDSQRSSMFANGSDFTNNTVSNSHL